MRGRMSLLEQQRNEDQRTFAAVHQQRKEAQAALEAVASLRLAKCTAESGYARAVKQVEQFSTLLSSQS